MVELDTALSATEAELARFAGLELRSTLCDNKSVDGIFLRLSMRLQLELLRQISSQHRLGAAIQGFLFGGHVRRQLRTQIPGVLVDPCGAARQFPGLKLDIRPGVHDQVHEGVARACELRGVNSLSEGSARAGRFDGRHFERVRGLGSQQQQRDGQHYLRRPMNLNRTFTARLWPR